MRYEEMNKSSDTNSITEQMVIGITMGDAAGIGPEVVVKALSDPHIRRLRSNLSGAGINTKKSAGTILIKWSWPITTNILLSPG
ncbi:MAG: hypothetical protein ACYSU5_26135 [Planctomycetota bacterium]|jgi:hypothetical protein